LYILFFVGNGTQAVLIREAALSDLRGAFWIMLCKADYQGPGGEKGRSPPASGMPVKKRHLRKKRPEAAF
jgi:hypothetical protein